jgi:hypothetical protein
MTFYHGNQDADFRVVQPNNGGRQGRCYRVSAYYARTRTFHVAWDDGDRGTVLETEVEVLSGDSSTPSLDHA